MDAVTKILTRLPDLPMERINALIVLSALGLAIFALYVVLTVVKARTEK